MASLVCLWSVLGLLCTVCSSAESSCDATQEDQEETSLMQITKALKLGTDRTGRHVDKAETASGAAGTCQFMGCFGWQDAGHWGNCDGNENDCTSRGFTVKAYATESAQCGTGKCDSGQLVLCEKCSEPVTPAVTTGAPPTAPPPPVFPPAPPTTTAAPAPTPAPVSIAPAGADMVEALKVNETQLAVHEALEDLTELKKALDNATKLGNQLSANVSKAEADIVKYTRLAHEDRAAAVRFGEKKALANQSLQRAQLALDDAITGEAAASNQALVEGTMARNAITDKLHYKKLLVDQESAENAALENLHFGRVAVKRAYANLASAKRSNHTQSALDSRRTNIERIAAHHNNVMAEETEVKDSMEDAFVESSLDRNLNNTPSWGEHHWAPEFIGQWGK